MRKFLPFIFPLIAFLIVVFLLWRWFNLRNQRPGQVNLDDLKTQVEELLPENGSSSASPSPGSPGRTVPTPVADLKSFTLQSLPGATGSAQEAQGTIRYAVENNQVNLQVFADLLPLSQGEYQVWSQSSASAQAHKLATLHSQKGGYGASFTVSKSQFPLDFLISEELKNDSQLEKVILKGRLEKP